MGLSTGTGIKAAAQAFNGTGQIFLCIIKQSLNIFKMLSDFQGMGVALQYILID